MKKEDKMPIDSNGKKHGYWERYYYGNLWFKGYFIHGDAIGYWEVYNLNGQLDNKEYIIF